jgi:hypothetical protein
MFLTLYIRSVSEHKIEMGSLTYKRAEGAAKEENFLVNGENHQQPLS